MAPCPAVHRKTWPEALMVALVVFAVGWTYFHDARVVGLNLTSVPPPGYYGGLTEAFLD